MASTQNPSLNISLSLLPAYRAEDQDKLPGPVLAENLRKIADDIENGINVLPYPGGVWTDETHTVTSEGEVIGTYRLPRL